MSIYDTAARSMSLEIDRSYRVNGIYDKYGIGYTSEEMNNKVREIYVRNMRPVHEKESRDREDLIKKIDDIKNKNKITSIFFISFLGLSALAVCAKVRLIICALMIVSLFINTHFSSAY